MVATPRGEDHLLMLLAKLVAEQLRQPSGLVGRAFGVILNRANRRINERVVERLDVHPGLRVLDIGFGGGEGLSCVLKRSVNLAAGIEISAPMLRQGRSRFRREIDAGIVELARGDVGAIPYDDHTFDRVFSVNTIYFWPDPAAGVQEILRVLKPGGRMMLGTESAEAMKRRSFIRHGFALFSEAHLERLLRDAGVVEISVDCVEGWVLTQGQESRDAHLRFEPRRIRAVSRSSLRPPDRGRRRCGLSSRPGWRGSWNGLTREVVQEHRPWRLPGGSSVRAVAQRERPAKQPEPRPLAPAFLAAIAPNRAPPLLRVADHCGRDVQRRECCQTTLEHR